ncbi:FIST signal transduction protein [Kineococcus sp. SYSU DK002]|uniref:FIST signal transduction protein n=1 Tax=Kineococcus sp. SYSU DK002 TaxID=3383123 RepID=UPI003D7EABF0
MRVGSVRWTAAGGWAGELPDLDSAATLVLVLLGPETDLGAVPLAEVAAAYPTSLVTGCSTAGVADGPTLLDDGVLVLVCAFERTRVLLRPARQSAERSHAVGQALTAGLHADAAAAGTDLRAVLVICDGLDVVGNAFAQGLASGAAGVPVFGGMSALMPGPGGTIRAPWTVLDGALQRGVAVAVGLCGDHVTLTCGTGGGWDELGPPRTATRSSGAELLEIDGQPALDLYRRYLGVEAEGLPGSGLRFPLLLRRPGEQQSALVRSVRSFDEGTRAIGLTGDVPEGAVVQLLHQNSEAMVDAAQDAARAAAAGAGPAHVADGALALVVSCLGRRLALGARVEDELEPVALELGPGTVVAGFYGYGELAPTPARSCDLHNQTVAVGAISEWTW